MINKLKTIEEMVNETGTYYSNSRVEEIANKVNEIVDVINKFTDVNELNRYNTNL